MACHHSVDLIESKDILWGLWQKSPGGQTAEPFLVRRLIHHPVRGHLQFDHAGEQ